VNTDSSTATLSGTLTNLPSVSSLDLYYTSSTTNLCHDATVPVTNGVFTAIVPADCVFTFSGFSLP
jgi:O-glycosyl hydrolase